MFIIKESIAQKISTLVKIISNYDVNFFVQKSKVSKSQYLYINAKKMYCFRISDHELPPESIGNEYNKHIDKMFNFTEREIEEAKKQLKEIIKNEKLEKVLEKQKWVDFRNEIYNEYVALNKKAYLEKWENSNYIMECSIIFQAMKFSTKTELKKIGQKTVKQLFKDAELNINKDIQKILDKFNVE